MKLTEAARILGVNIQSAHKIFEKTKTKLSGCWYINKQGLKLLDEMTYSPEKQYIHSANKFLCEDEDISETNYITKKIMSVIQNFTDIKIVNDEQASLSVSNALNMSIDELITRLSNLYDTLQG